MIANSLYHILSHKICWFKCYPTFSLTHLPSTVWSRSYEAQLCSFYWSKPKTYRRQWQFWTNSGLLKLNYQSEASVSLCYLGKQSLFNYRRYLSFLTLLPSPYSSSFFKYTKEERIWFLRTRLVYWVSEYIFVSFPSWLCTSLLFSPESCSLCFQSIRYKATAWQPFLHCFSFSNHSTKFSFIFLVWSLHATSW